MYEDARELRVVGSQLCLERDAPFAQEGPGVYIAAAVSQAAANFEAYRPACDRGESMQHLSLFGGQLTDYRQHDLLTLIRLQEKIDPQDQKG